MTLTFDPRYNVAYLKLQEKTAQVETIRVCDGLNVDIAPDGTVYGIELLDANRQLRVFEGGTVTIVNEASGNRAAVPIPN
jgi:uncharacterized protein YuzE